MNLCQPYYIEPRKGLNHLDLCGEWAYTYTEQPSETIAELNWNLKTQVPNSVFWSLYESGILPHPYKGCNSKLYAWVDEKVWYYRRRFYLSHDQDLGDAFLCVDGAAYFSRVWVNGSLIGEHEGMFGGPAAEIGRHLNFNGVNEIVIEVKACDYGNKDKWDPWNGDGSNREIVPWNLARDHYTSNGDFIVIGLWKGVRIEFLPKLHISRPYLTTESLSEGKAKLHLRLEIADGTIEELKVKSGNLSGNNGYTRAYDNGLSGIKKDEAVTLRIEIAEKESGREVYFGEENIRLNDYGKSGIDPEYYELQFYNRDLVIDGARLWYPHDMGEPFLYTVKISLLSGDKLCDEQSFDYGIRTIELTQSAGEQYRTRWGDFQFVVNGKKVFLKGMNWMPVDFLLKQDRAEVKWSLELVKNAGIHLLRVWSGGGIPESDDFYELCDELGLMVWQDNFIANMDTPNWPQNVLQAQVCMNLYRIRNHPALAVHCGGNEFNPYSPGNAASMFMIKTSIEDLDPARPFMRTTADKGSAHIYRDMEPIWYRRLYRQLPFLAESGIHSFPNVKSLRQLLSADEFHRSLSDIFSDEFRDKNPELLNHFSEYVPERIPRMLARASCIHDIHGISLEDLVEATQISSCEFYQIMIEAMRENYPVTTGIMPWVFKRPWTTVGIQLVDGMGDPIAPYYAVKNAYHPLLALVSLGQLTYAPGESVQLPVKVINGGAEEIAGAVVELQVFDPSMQAVFEHKQSVSLTERDYQKVFFTDVFHIPDDYSETFFFIRVAVREADKIRSQTVYWLKCLERMKDSRTRELYRSSPQPNILFDKGPWLKKQIEGAPKAQLSCDIVSVSEDEDRIRVRLKVANLSGAPAFPVRIDTVNDATVCKLSENYYFHNPFEEKEIDLEVYSRNPGLDRLSIEISAWNSEKITRSVALKGMRG